MNTHCALCPVTLSEENWTKEHIIPNSIGGIVKIGGFICNSCNNNKGATWDTVLADQFHWLSLTLGIVRDRGEVPPAVVETVSGKRFNLLNNGSLEPAEFAFSRVEEDGSVKISMTPRTMKEATRKINELAKRYPKINKAQALEQAQIKTTYLKEPLKIQLQFGGELADRSVVKTALAFAFSRGIPSSICENTQEFLLSEPVLDEAGQVLPSDASCCGLGYLSDLVKDRPHGAFFHCLGLYSDQASNQLFAYVEYFGLARWLIVLSKRYDGPPINEIYALDPTTGKPAHVTLNWPLADEDVKKIVSGYGFENYHSELEKMIGPLLRRADERSLNNTLETALKISMEKYGLKPGAPISKTQAVKIASEVANAMAAHISHQMDIPNREIIELPHNNTQ
jgi:hypothetical protein